MHFIMIATALAIFIALAALPWIGIPVALIAVIWFIRKIWNGLRGAAKWKQKLAETGFQFDHFIKGTEFWFGFDDKQKKFALIAIDTYILYDYDEVEEFDWQWTQLTTGLRIDNELVINFKDGRKITIKIDSESAASASHEELKVAFA